MDQGSNQREKNIRVSRTNEDTVKIACEGQWNNLPINCLVDIFQRLSLYELTLSVPFVCKAWYEASLDPTCWKILDFRTINPWPGGTFAEEFKRAYRLDEYRIRWFLDFIMHRSCRLAVLLMNSPSRPLPVCDLIYILEGCPKLDLDNPPTSVNNPGFMRSLILEMHNSLLRCVADWY